MKQQENKKQTRKLKTKYLTATTVEVVAIAELPKTRAKTLGTEANKFL